MSQEGMIGRRQVVRAGGALGLAGLGFGGGMLSRASRALAAPTPVTIVNPSGSLTLVFEQLLTKGKYFEPFGLDPTMQNVSDGSKVIAALVSGSGDLCGGGGFSSVFPAIERGAKIKIVAGAALSPITCIFSKRPDIKSAADLVGKNVGTGAPGALLHELVVALLIKKGVDYTKVNFVNVGSGPDVFKAVVAGTVDAGPAEIDFYSQQEKYGIHALSDGALWDELPEYTNQAMLASDDAIAKKRDVLVKTMAAHAKLYRFVNGDPASKQAWIDARLAAFGKSDEKDAVLQWEFFQHPDRLATDLVLSQARIEYVQKLNVRLGVQQKVLPFEQVADMSLARDAVKLLG